MTGKGSGTGGRRVMGRNQGNWTVRKGVGKEEDRMGEKNVNKEGREGGGTGLTGKVGLCDETQPEKGRRDDYDRNR